MESSGQLECVPRIMLSPETNNADGWLGDLNNMGLTDGFLNLSMSASNTSNISISIANGWVSEFEHVSK